MALLELIEKSADTDLVREMLHFAAERMMDLEVHACTGAAHGVRDPARVVQRNGYRAPAWGTRAAGLELQTPRGVGAATRPDRAADPAPAPGQLLPLLSRAPPDGGEGADRGDPGSVYPGR